MMSEDERTVSLYDFKRETFLIDLLRPELCQPVQKSAFPNFIFSSTLPGIKYRLQNTDFWELTTASCHRRGHLIVLRRIVTHNM